MSNIPGGAQDEVEKLSMNLAMSINGWLGSTNKSEEFKMGVVMSTLSNSLVMWSILYDVPAEAVIKSVITTLHANGAFGDDDETVH